MNYLQRQFLKNAILFFKELDDRAEQRTQLILEEIRGLQGQGANTNQAPVLTNNSFLEREERFFYEAHLNKTGSLKTLLDHFPTVNSAKRLYNLTPKEIEAFPSCGEGAVKLFFDLKKKCDNDFLPKNVTQSKILFK